jgi:hypothetical protein
MVLKLGLICSILYPGKLNVGHACAYLPDVATTIAQLLEQEAVLDSFLVFHIARNCHSRRGVRAKACDPPVSLAPGLRPQSVRHRIPEMLELRNL